MCDVTSYHRCSSSSSREAPAKVSPRVATPTDIYLTALSSSARRHIIFPYLYVTVAHFKAIASSHINHHIYLPNSEANPSTSFLYILTAEPKGEPLVVILVQRKDKTHTHIHHILTHSYSKYTHPHIHKEAGIRSWQNASNVNFLLMLASLICRICDGKQRGNGVAKRANGKYCCGINIKPVVTQTQGNINIHHKYCQTWRRCVGPHVRHLPT